MYKSVVYAFLNVFSIKNTIITFLFSSWTQFLILLNLAYLTLRQYFLLENFFVCLEQFRVFVNNVFIKRFLTFFLFLGSTFFYALMYGHIRRRARAHAQNQPLTLTRTNTRTKLHR